MSSDRRRELAELRSRAYGRDADIHSDSVAMARLLELEDLARTDDSPEVVEVDPHTDSPVQASDPHGRHSPQVVREPAESDGTDASEEARADAPEPARRSRRLPTWTYIAAAALLGLVVGIAVPALSPPHPDAVLSQTSRAGGPALDYDMYRLRADSAVRYETFHELEVWSAQNDQGATCIVVTTAALEWMTATCAPEPLDPVADLTFYPGMTQIDGLELAEGSVLRFLLRGDVIEVWIGETAEGA
jgi:hypothetical protein